MFLGERFLSGGSGSEKKVQKEVGKCGGEVAKAEGAGLTIEQMLHLLEMEGVGQFKGEEEPLWQSGWIDGEVHIGGEG